MRENRASGRRPAGAGCGWALWCACLLFATTAFPAALTPEQLQQVRAATFEVVVAKNEPTAVKYEKPLPMELVPYQVRNDLYWSIGTAFQIAPGRFASAAHVVTSAIGSPFGPLSLRDAAGRIYPVQAVEKFSEGEDFSVFTVAGAPTASLPTSTDYHMDSPVFAVGNALGEGVIARDGLLTSMTPEALEGRWKWLRFSAATSPGNSGGPLLDEQGRIIGLVIGKSENENLNYALPIDRLLDNPGKVARIENRGAFPWRSCAIHSPTGSSVNRRCRCRSRTSASGCSPSIRSSSLSNGPACSRTRRYSCSRRAIRRRCSRRSSWPCGRG